MQVGKIPEQQYAQSGLSIAGRHKPRLSRCMGCPEEAVFSTFGSELEWDQVKLSNIGIGSNIEKKLSNIGIGSNIKKKLSNIFPALQSFQIQHQESDFLSPVTYSQYFNHFDDQIKISQPYHGKMLNKVK